MKSLYCFVIGICLMICSCASGGYQEPYYGQQGYQGYYEEPYYTGNVPPEFYNYDPSLSQWYTFPYWQPDEED
jgi:hypothetical protein